MSNTTIDYYNTHADSFISSTVNADISDMLQAFLHKLPSGAVILDWGCGSGRDSYAMLQAGYTVDSVDLSEAMVKTTEKLTGRPVIHASFFDLDAENIYDGIWACSSLLHIEKDKLPELFTKASKALVTDGIMYVSFKYGDFSGIRNGRYFTDLTETSLQEILEDAPSLTILKHWTSGDVRPGHSHEQWLNALLIKQN